MKALLLLWDIDGTLISARGSGTAALCDSLEASFGIRSDLHHIEIQGRTDRWIFERMLRAFDLPVTDENLQRLETNYLAALEPQLGKRGVEVLPGVESILAGGAARGTVAHGLLTGNLVEGAKRKMGPVALWKHFPFGAFADDASNRNELGPKALERARRHHGLDFDLSRVWVIGDTPHDITCGKAFGARTLAVATGRFSVAELQAGSPCAVFENLSDQEAFWRTVEA